MSIGINLVHVGPIFHKNLYKLVLPLFGGIIEGSLLQIVSVSRVESSLDENLGHLDGCLFVLDLSCGKEGVLFVLSFVSYALDVNIVLFPLTHDLVDISALDGLEKVLPDVLHLVGILVHGARAWGASV